MLLGGCAQQILNASQSACASYGFAPGTNAFASCVQTEFSRRQAMIQQGLGSLAQPQQPIQPVGGGAGHSGAFLRKEVVQGMNRICFYDHLGSAVAITIGAAELCPQMLP